MYRMFLEQCLHIYGCNMFIKESNWRRNPSSFVEGQFNNVVEDVLAVLMNVDL